MKDYKRLGIVALVLDAIAALSLIFVFLNMTLVIVPISIILIASIIISIISLKGIKKHHSGGIRIPVSALAISAILIIPTLYFLYFFGLLFLAFMIPETVNTYKVPMTVTIDTYNVDFSSLGSSDKRDIFIFTHPKGDDFPEECSPEFFQFHSLRELIYFEEDVLYPKTAPEGYSRNYRGNAGTFPLDLVKDKPSGERGITFPLGEKASRTYRVELNEKNNRPGTSKKLLESGNDEFYIRYSYLPAIADPGKEYAINTTGCYAFSNPYSKGILEIKGVSGKETRHEKQIICVKQFHIYDFYEGKFELDDCTFYELSYDINIEYSFDLSKGEKKKTVVPVHI